jgi:thiamine-phosphate pyrophosphorylase
MIDPLRGLYAVTPDATDDPSRLAKQVAQAIEGGAKLIQFRDKRSTAPRRLRQAEALLAICRPAGIPLIINDDLALAHATGADGVHLGRDDADPRHARERLGDGAIIGVSCYNDFRLAAIAEQADASYVAFGSFFPSTTKPLAIRADPGLLIEARQRLRVPPVAIGGITPQNGSLLIMAGARMLAVVTGVFAQPDIAAAARAYSNLFPKECFS